MEKAVGRSRHRRGVNIKALYSCCLFYDALSNSDYAESKVVMTGKSERNGKNVPELTELRPQVLRKTTN